MRTTAAIRRRARSTSLRPSNASEHVEFDVACSIPLLWSLNLHFAPSLNPRGFALVNVVGIISWLPTTLIIRPSPGLGRVAMIPTLARMHM